MHSGYRQSVIDKMGNIIFLQDVKSMLSIIATRLLKVLLFNWNLWCLSADFTFVKPLSIDLFAGQHWSTNQRRNSGGR